MRTPLRSRLAEQERRTARAIDESAVLRKDLRLCRAVLDVLPIGVVVRDASGRERLRNRRGSSPTGDIQADALVATAVDSLIDAAAASHRDDAGPWQEVVELHGPPRRSVEVTVHRLGDDTAVAITEDASDRRRVEELRRDFVDNVNHELRTPIGALGVLVEALQGESDAAVIQRLTARMGAEVQRAQALIEDLLELSKIERGGDPVHVPVEVAAVVDAAVRHVEAAADRAQVRLDIATGAPSPVIEGSLSQLVSALTNLLDNAIKYSPAGSAIEVAVHQGDAAVDIVVRDRGLGIPAKDLGRIFERFYRVDRARDRRTGGTGLGLAIVRNVAVNHGGEVTVSSVEGVGSTFTLRLKSSR